MSHSSFKVPEGYRAEFFQKVDSTNSEALRRAELIEKPGLWILAHEQSAGRGREGRKWISGPGNLTTSLLLRPQTNLMTALQLSFVSGVALHRTLTNVLKTTDRASEIRLKWPNDVLIDNRKVAGILLESNSGSEDQWPYIAVGFGINIFSHPENSEIQATDLSSYRMDLAVSMVFEQLAKSMDELLNIWNTGQNFKTVRLFWLGAAHKTGEVLTVKTGQEQISGKFDTIDDEGALLLKLKSGATERILVGDVYLNNDMPEKMD